MEGVSVKMVESKRKHSDQERALDNSAENRDPVRMLNRGAKSKCGAID